MHRIQGAMTVSCLNVSSASLFGGLLPQSVVDFPGTDWESKLTRFVRKKAVFNFSKFRTPAKFFLTCFYTFVFLVAGNSLMRAQIHGSIYLNKLEVWWPRANANLF